MQIRKILATFVSVVMICTAVSVPAYAAQETQIVTDLVSPAYEYAMCTKSYLTITSSTAECKSVRWNGWRYSNHSWAYAWKALGSVDMEWSWRRKLDKDCIFRHHKIVQHKIRAWQRYISAEIRFHADKLKRQERNYHYLQRRRNNLNILIVAKTTW